MAIARPFLKAVGPIGWEPCPFTNSVKTDDLLPDIPKTNPLWWSGRTGWYSRPARSGRRSNGGKSHWPLTDSRGAIKTFLLVISFVTLSLIVTTGWEACDSLGSPSENCDLPQHFGNAPPVALAFCCPNGLATAYCLYVCMYWGEGVGGVGSTQGLWDSLRLYVLLAHPR